LATTLNLGHYGLGDETALQLADCIHSLPCIEEVNLCDDKLTDVSLPSLLNAPVKIPTLRSIDLSQNDIDSKTSVALAEFLADPNLLLNGLTVIESAASVY
jgi:Ran GTPase-activating protein (RanGAP) involved in mRNA processing and transport